MSNEGVRYLNPEVALLFKARQQRSKDDLDLDNALPLLTDRQRGWLRDAVRRAYGDHDWIERLDSDD
ncbi:MAG: hypothetical protein ACXWXO_20630 [Nocardioides sp.]